MYDTMWGFQLYDTVWSIATSSKPISSNAISSNATWSNSQFGQ